MRAAYLDAPACPRTPGYAHLISLRERLRAKNHPGDTFPDTGGNRPELEASQERGQEEEGQAHDDDVGGHCRQSSSF